MGIFPIESYTKKRIYKCNIFQCNVYKIKKTLEKGAIAP
ncbi:hypothetical protein SAMN05421668_11840 [Halolactibacillus miurensis]|uniref:Uncharacterized protein n=1 Tax=Halolactibacillus miurensis TaxID=306541 RepID=A0A1I6TVA5_9BACI|nr:hypothetical protein SAMN05421668_11840 [Halolactibacillus miurensis]